MFYNVFFQQSLTTIFDVFFRCNHRNNFFTTISDGCNSRCKRSSSTILRPGLIDHFGELHLSNINPEVTFYSSISPKVADLTRSRYHFLAFPGTSYKFLCPNNTDILTCRLVSLVSGFE